MFDVLVRGSLAKDPQVRMGKSGKPFTTGALIVRDGDTSLLVSLIAFGSEGERLGTMAKGEALSVAGIAKMTEWTGNDGTLQRGMSVTASKVLTLADAKREVKKKVGGPAAPNGASPSPAKDEEPFFDDPIPF